MLTEHFYSMHQLTWLKICGLENAMGLDKSQITLIGEEKKKKLCKTIVMVGKAKTEINTHNDKLTES